MKRVERIGVSLDKKLLSMFDKLIAKQGYQSRLNLVLRTPILPFTIHD